MSTLSLSFLYNTIPNNMKKYFYLLISLFTGLLSAGAQGLPEDGKIYRISNVARDNSVVMENFMTHKLHCGEKSGTDISQLWKFSKTEESWSIQNMLTDRYIQIESNNINNYATAESVAQLYISLNTTLSAECYNILNENGGNMGLHCESDFDVVPWRPSTGGSSNGSEWNFEKVEISDEEIAAAKENYGNLSHIITNKDEIMVKYSAHFTDESCTELKSEYSSMSDEELAASMEGCGEILISFALKVKNNGWAAREKEFRVQSYAPYSDPEVWGNKLQTFPYSWLSNPTGICTESGDVLYIFVGKEPKEGATLEIDAIDENKAKGERTILKKGLNIIPVTRGNRSLFIIYTADTQRENLISDFDSIPIHIEGGYVNGYWDKSRHTDDDWADITRNHAKHDYILVKGSKIMYFMKRSAITASNVCPNTISDAIGWWDNMIAWQHEIMGLEDCMPSRFNNLLCAISTESGFMSATGYVTNYSEGSLWEILPFNTMMQTSGRPWGPSHENGHVHQGAINMIGCTEASNNLFSNISVFKLGKFATWGEGVDVLADYYVNKEPWTLQGIGMKMRMYFQLYLYYHVAGHNPQFYPTLFKFLREEPLEKQAGGYDNTGRADLLHFAEKCCEASGEDMTDFFEAWGFFVPMSRATIGDYGDWTISSTKRMITDTKKKMAKYPKKPGAIQFIEDRAAYSLRTDGGEGYKLEYEHGRFAETGQYTAYYPDSMNITASGYIYSKTGNLLNISKGKNAVGFKVYDSDSTLLTFANKHSINLTDEIAAKELIIVAVSANGTEVTVNSKNNGSEEDQYEALGEALESAASVLTLKDEANKYVGYYYETAMLNLVAIVDSAQAAYDSKDQSVHKYGIWATLIDKEIGKIISDDDNRVKIQSGNTYQLYNVRYPAYSMYYENGKIICKSGATTPKSRRFTVISTGKENEFYISVNGKYLNYIGKSEQVTATTSTKNEALKFTFGEHGLAKYYFHKKGDTELGLHSSSSYVVVGWNHDEEPSLWRLVAVDQKKEKADAEALNALIDEAEGIFVQIVDTTNTASITFNEGIEVTSGTLASDVELMMAKAAESGDAITNKYYNLCPALIEELTSAIASVKAGYTVNTGIGSIGADDKEAVIYDIRGRRINRISSSGIYFINGKKIYLNK